MLIRLTVHVASIYLDFLTPFQVLFLSDECIMCCHEVLVNFGNSLCDECIYAALYGTSVNYFGNSSCDERTYQPYIECQQTTLVILCVMNVRTSLIWSISKLIL